MANYYFRNTGNTNWGTTTNWSLSSGGPGNGAVPTSVDNAYFDANSGNCIISTTERNCNQLITTGYTRTITLSSNLNVFGNVTIGASTTIAGTSYLVIVNNNTFITSNSVFIPNLKIGLSSGLTVTLVDSVTTVGNFIAACSTSGTISLNSGTLNITGSVFTVGNSFPNNFSGSTSITVSGNTTIQTLGSSTILKNINIQSSGTVTLTGNLRYTGTITRTSGTVVASSCNLLTGGNISFAGSGWDSIPFLGIQFSGSSAISLNSNFFITNLVFPITAGCQINGAYFLYISGNITFSSSGILYGTTTLVITGNSPSVWSSTGTSTLRNNLTINKTSTLTISGVINYNSGTFTYTSGTVIATGSTLNSVGSTTFNTSGITWNIVNFSSESATFTLLSQFTANGLVTVGSLTTNERLYINGSMLLANGGFRVHTSPFLSGTSTIRVTGGTLSQTNGGWVTNNNFEVSGNVTIQPGSTSQQYAFYFVGYSSGLPSRTFSATGSISATDAHMWFNACNLHTPGVTFGNVDIIIGAGYSGAPLTMKSDLIVNGRLSLGAQNNTVVQINNDGSNRNIYVYNGLTFSIATNVTTQGSSNIIMKGGTIYGSVTNTIKNNFQIDGNVTFAPGTTFSYNTGTFSYLSGNVTTTNSVLKVTNSTTFNTTGMTWSNVYVETNLVNNTGTQLNITSGSKFSISNNLTLRGLRFDNPAVSPSSINSPISVRSTVIGSSAYLIHDTDDYSRQNIAWTTATDIDSSDGLPIYAYSDTIFGTTSTFVRTQNWNLLTPPIVKDVIMDFY